MPTPSFARLGWTICYQSLSSPKNFEKTFQHTMKVSSMKTKCEGKKLKKNTVFAGLFSVYVLTRYKTFRLPISISSDLCDKINSNEPGTEK